MNPEVPAPGPAIPPGPEPAAPDPGPAPAPGPAPTPRADASWGSWLSGDAASHAARKAERQARREARRAEHGMGGSFWGVLLVIVGAGILASELIPGFDWDLAWPTVLIAFGILLVVGSFRRAPSDT
jgi:hypothetical protein